MAEKASFEKGIGYVAELFQLLLSYLIPPKLHQLSAGRCIVQAAKPRTAMYPVSFDLVDLDKTLGSK